MAHETQPARSSSRSQDTACTSGVVGTEKVKQKDAEVEVIEGNGFLFNLRLRGKVHGSPTLVYKILTDPNSVGVFRGIKDCTYRKVLEENPTTQQRKIEVAHRAIARFLFINVTFETRLHVWEDDREKKIRFCNAREGFMKRFEGSWEVAPCTDNLKHKLVHPFSAWQSKLSPQPEPQSSMVTLEQALLPRTPAPPGIRGLIRRLCAKQAMDMMEDLRAEVDRREGRTQPKANKKNSSNAGKAAGAGAAAAASITLARPLDLWDIAAPINITIHL